MSTRWNLAALTIVVGLSTAHADQPSYFSTQAALTGNSTMALDRSGGAAWLNPAGLAGTGELRVELSGTAFVLQLRDYSHAVVANLPSGRKLLDANGSELNSIPAALVFVRRLHPRVSAALGVFVTNLEHYQIDGVTNSTEQFSGARTRFSSLAARTLRCRRKLIALARRLASPSRRGSD